MIFCAAGPPVRRVGLFAKDVALTAPMPRAMNRSGQCGRALGREHLDLLVLQAAQRAGAKVWQPWKATRLHRAVAITIAIASAETAPNELNSPACHRGARLMGARHVAEPQQPRAQAVGLAGLQGALHQLRSGGGFDAAAGVSRRLWRHGSQRRRAREPVVLHPARRAGRYPPAPSGAACRRRRAGA